MRRKITTLILLTIILAIPFYSVIGVENKPMIDLSRNVNIQLGGITTISDTITLKAPEGETINIQSLWMGYLDIYKPDNLKFKHERVLFELKQDNGWTPLSYKSEIRGDNYGYLLEFPSILTLSGSEYIEIRAKYTHIDLIIQASSNIAFIPTYPIFEYNITSLKLSIQLPESSKYESYEAPFNITNNNNSDGIWRFYYNSTNISDWENVTAAIQYKPSINDSYILYFESLEHVLRIKPNYIEISEIYEIHNVGTGLQMFSVNIPSIATDIWAYDNVGSIYTESQEEENITETVEVLVYSRGAIYYDNKWKFTLSYKLPNDEYFSEQTFTYKIKNYEYYVRELKASVVIPEGGDYISSTPEPNNIIKNEDTKIKYIFGSRLPYEEDTFSVDLSLSSLNTWIRPLVALALTAGIFGGVVYLRKQRKPESIKKVKVKNEKPVVSEYVNKYIERISILKKYYDILQSNVEGNEVKLTELSQQLDKSLKEIKQDEENLQKEEIAKVLNKIFNAEKDIANIKNDLNNLEIRLRTRRLSKKDFERRKEIRIKRLYETIKEIEEALISLA